MNIIVIAQPYQTSFRIITNCERLTRILKLKYGKYLLFSDQHTEKDIIAIKKKNLYYITFEENTIRNKSGILTIDDIIFHNTQYNCNIFAIHGAAVEWQKKAYLFVASTTSGKSTLTSYLTNMGFGYITDDCILLDRQTFKIYPHTTPIHLRDGGLKILTQYKSIHENLETIEDKEIKRHVYTPQNCINESVSLGKIFFINRTNAKNYLMDMTTTQRIIALMKAPITPYSITPEYLAFLSELSNKDCKELYYCDMNFVAENIKNESNTIK